MHTWLCQDGDSNILVLDHGLLIAPLDICYMENAKTKACLEDTQHCDRRRSNVEARLRAHDRRDWISRVENCTRERRCGCKACYLFNVFQCVTYKRALRETSMENSLFYGTNVRPVLCVCRDTPAKYPTAKMHRLFFLV